MRGAFLLLTGNGAFWLASFVRNLVVARLLSVEDYGIATTFALTAMLVEMASQIGLKQLIVQAEEGEEPRFQSALQGFHLLRGIAAAILLLALAEPIARFLGVPEIAWAYHVVALVPLLQGFTHFDVYRFERRFQYRPGILMLSLASLTSLAAVWPLFWLFGDWRVMLAAILLQEGLQAALSHVMARRPYRARLDPALVRRAVRFGWPLLLNGLLMFAVFHGEKLIAGRELGLAALGIFSMGVTLTLTPTLLGTKTLQSLLLPRLSRAGGDRFRQFAVTACEASALVAILTVAGVALLGPVFILIVLGPKFEPLLPLLVPLGVAMGVRMMKTGPSVVALSRARSTLPMLAQLPRLASIALAWVVLIRGGDLLDLALIAVAGELAGVVLAFWLMRGVEGAPAGWLGRGGTAPILLMLAVLGADLLRRHPAAEGLSARLPGSPTPETLVWLAVALMLLWGLVLARGALIAVRRT